MATIVKSNLGPETQYSVNFSAGALNFAVTYVGAQANMNWAASLSAVQLIAAFEQHITNPIERAALETLSAIISRIP